MNNCLLAFFFLLLNPPPFLPFSTPAGKKKMLRSFSHFSPFEYASRYPSDCLPAFFFCSFSLLLRLSFFFSIVFTLCGQASFRRKKKDTSR
jgi:hypothetical protein